MKLGFLMGSMGLSLADLRNRQSVYILKDSFVLVDSCGFLAVFPTVLEPSLS